MRLWRFPKQFVLSGVISLLLVCATTSYAEQSLVDLTQPPGKRITPSTPAEVSVAYAGNGATVTVKPGKDNYPGVTLHPEGALYDLSAFGHVEARVSNTGSDTLGICLRVDNDGDWSQNPWNAETLYPKPGETVTVRVRFGYSWGKPAYKLNPEKIARLLVFVAKPKAEQSFRIESIVAGGSPGEKPPVNPQNVRTKPATGVILASGKPLDAATKIETQNAEARQEAQGVQVKLKAGTSMVKLQPALGRWDLSDWLQVVVRARNTGAQPVTLKARLESAPGVTEWIAASKPMAAGEAREVVLPFGSGSAIVMKTDGRMLGASPFESDRASGIAVAATGEGESSLVIESVQAVVPPPPALPDWLGKRPPVPGNWQQTLAEEFNGKTINESVWTIYHPNYWDKQSHFSKANVILDNGVVRLRFEKKRGHADDDPAKPQTDYATGFLTSTHKWTQKYGYFECRMKLPKAPGMWPAFWMMPDRGAEAGNSREDTHNGGMEVDILEHLARYGPFRYNIAFHWDGYGKAHKSIGTDRFYVQPDKDGFYTAGLLWEPGRMTFYCNGALIAQWEDPRVASVPAYILFTAVSGGWGGNELTGEGLPDDLVLDYVRAWKKLE